MATRLFVGLCVLGTIALASIADAQVSGAKAKDPALQVAIDARQQAITTRNAAEWSKYTADDFVILTADGTMQSRAERLKYMATNKGNSNPVSIDRVTMFGPDAAVVTQHNPTATSTAAPTRTTTFWVRQGGTWKVATTVFSPYKPN